MRDVELENQNECLKPLRHTEVLACEGWKIQRQGDMTRSVDVLDVHASEHLAVSTIEGLRHSGFILKAYKRVH